MKTEKANGGADGVRRLRAHFISLLLAIAHSRKYLRPSVGQPHLRLCLFPRQLGNFALLKASMLPSNPYNRLTPLLKRTTGGADGVRTRDLRIDSPTF